ncbi:MAG: biopolymer transporter ExbD [Sphingobacteriales bacterium]|nr:biopolymer transporter ExbD [Sphingobacteriales bacterium]
MAEVQSNEQDSGKGGKHKKVRAKKQSTHIDMTPMVDLAFLLLTFFMLTTTFGKPKTMEINMPVKPELEDQQTLVNNAITILLTGDNKIYWYFGELKPETTLSPTNYSQEGLRKLLLEKNQYAFDKIKQLREQAVKTNMADTTLKRLEVETKGEKKALMVLVKADDKAIYKNVVDVLDELNITMVGKYAIVDIGQQEYDLMTAMK